MNLFDKDNVLKHYDTVEDIIREYAQVRLDAYTKRIAKQIELLIKALEACKLKVEILEEINSGKITIGGKRKAQIIQELGDEKASVLLKMGIANLTLDDLEDYYKEIKKIEGKIEHLKSTTANEEWERDLIELEKELGGISSSDTKSGKRQLPNQHIGPVPKIPLVAPLDEED